MVQLDLEMLGERIAYYRTLNGLSASALADLAGAGVTRDVLANIETGRRKDVGVRQVVAIADALRVPITALVLPINAPDTGMGEGRSVLDVLVTLQGWETEPVTPAGSEVTAQFAAIRVFIQLKQRRDDALYSLAWPEDDDQTDRSRAYDETASALDSQIMVLRRLGITVDVDG